MRREEQHQNTMDGLSEVNDAPIDLTKKTDTGPKSSNDITENKPSPEWQIPSFYPPLFFLGGESTFRTFPAVAMANPFLLPYYPVLYEQLGLRYAMMQGNPGLESVFSNHCLYRTASDTYLKDHVRRSRERDECSGINLCRRREAFSSWSNGDDEHSGSDTLPSLRKCKSLGALPNGVQEDSSYNHSLSCPDLQFRANFDQNESNRPCDKKMKLDLTYSDGKYQKRENKFKYRMDGKFDLSEESRSRSMPSVSQRDQESFLQKLRHVAPAGFPCNVYGYYTHLMKKYQDHEEIKRQVGIIPESSPPSSPGPDTGKKRPARTLTGKHVRHGTGASPSTLLTLRQMIQERQRVKELAQNYGISTKCKVTRKHSNKSSGRRTT